MRAYLFFNDKYNPSAVEYVVIARNRSEAEDILLKDKENYIAEYLSECITTKPFNPEDRAEDFCRCKSVKTAIRRFFRRVVARPAKGGVVYDGRWFCANPSKNEGSVTMGDLRARVVKGLELDPDYVTDWFRDEISKGDECAVVRELCSVILDDSMRLNIRCNACYCLQCYDFGFGWWWVEDVVALRDQLRDLRNTPGIPLALKRSLRGVMCSMYP